MTNIIINNEATIKGNGTHGVCNNKPVICIDTGDVFVSVMDAAEHNGVSVTTMSNTCNGRQRTCKGKRFCFVSRAEENLDMMTDHIRSMSSERADLERKAALWDAYQKEQEEARKAEEERNAAIAKAEAKLECRKRIAATAEEKYMLALKRLAETERELADLKFERR